MQIKKLGTVLIVVFKCVRYISMIILELLNGCVSVQ